MKSTMKPAFITWFLARKLRDARISKQYQHNIPSGIV